AGGGTLRAARENTRSGDDSASRPLRDGDDSMAKTKTRYVCQECGYESARWLGQCGGCNAWNTMVEEAAPQAVKAPVLKTGGGGRLAGAYGTTRPQRLADVSVSDRPRLVTGLAEFDRVMGGG